MIVFVWRRADIYTDKKEREKTYLVGVRDRHIRYDGLMMTNYFWPRQVSGGEGH